MDQIDKHICSLLQINSRITYREIAEKTELTVNAIHNRIKNLIEKGIIKKFTTKLNLKALNGIRIFIIGSTNRTDFEEMGPLLGKHQNIYWVTFSSGNQAFIGADLQNIDEMSDVLSYVKNIAELEDVQVAIQDLQSSLPPENSSLSKRDYQILNSLRNDSRKALSEVATELGISAKTVRNRLEDMVQNSWVEFSIEWYPDLGNDIFNLILADVKPEVDIQSLGQKLYKDNFPNVVFFFTFNNIPETVMFVHWSNSMKEFKLFRQTLDMNMFEKFVPYTFHTGLLFDTWRDELLEERAKK